MSAGFRITPALWDKIHHFASFPQTGGERSTRDRKRVVQQIKLRSTVSLQQMVLFGQNPGQGTLLKASQFLAGTSFLILSHN